MSRECGGRKWAGSRAFNVNGGRGESSRVQIGYGSEHWHASIGLRIGMNWPDAILVIPIDMARARQTTARTDGGNEDSNCICRITEY